MASFRSLGWIVLATGVAACALVSTAGAQFTAFGKNKVQYTDFEWHVLESDHFDLYFYPAEEELARRTLAWAEESYAALADQLGTEVVRRIPLIVYSSHQDFQQTNVTPFFLPEGVAGLTEFMKGRVLMPFNGSYSQFRTTLHHELVHVFQLALTGNVYTKYFRYNIAHVPLWFSEGMADYLSERWSGVGEMILADFVIDGRLPPIQQLWRYNGTFTLYKLGQRLVGYLTETYGEDVISRIYDNLWISAEFTDVLAWVTGDPVSEISERWHLHERRSFYPRVQERQSIPLSARALTKKGVNFKPIEVPAGILGDERRLLFVSPRSGYTNIYSASFDAPEKDVEIVVEGERDAQFESLHPFVSKVDVSADGRLAFVSKWHERDALMVFDLTTHRLVGRYQFDHLLGLASPAWSRDGRLVVFEGLSDDAYSDLYLFAIDTQTLSRLTHDVYQDTDPDFASDDRTVVFSSDRTEYGEDDAKNLFVLDVETHQLRYLTRGPWTDSAPRCSADGERVFFSSTREGSPDLYEVDLDGDGRRLTRFLTGAMDPWPTADGESLLFTGYSKGTYHVYSLELEEARADSSTATDVVALEDADVAPGWWWTDPAIVGKAEAARYRRSFSLDFAAGGVVFDPLLTDAQGAQLAFTDMLGDEAVYAQIGNTSERGSNFLKRMNIGLSYLNLRKRLNVGYSVYHIAGDFRDDRDFIFFERRAGASLLANYPFSKFERLESSIGLAYSDKQNESTGVDRRAWVATNYLSWVHDNSLWVPTGPIDGTRIKASVGLTVDIPRADVESVQLLADWRRYHRVRQRSTWATRIQGRYATGSDPRYWTLGGSHSLRGYPRRSLFGTRALLVNNEYRFPVINGFVIGFPFGAVEFPGVEGAFFVDAGWLFNAGEDVPWPPLGSVGTSLRMSFGGYLVFRLDFARRTDFTSLETKTRSDFFIGWNY